MVKVKSSIFSKIQCFNDKNARAKILTNSLDKVQFIELNLSEEFVNILAF